MRLVRHIGTVNFAGVTVASLYPCGRCDQRGELRAQLVLTVLNADNGAVASASVTAGALGPRPCPEQRWGLALTPIIVGLAATVGATDLVDISSGWRPLDDDAIILPREWRPDLPVERREALITAAIATRSHNPWQSSTAGASSPRRPT